MVINYELMARQAEIRKQKEEEERKRNEGPNIGNILAGAAAAYLTAGLAPMLTGEAAALAPNVANVGTALLKGGADAASAKSTGEAVLSGVKTAAKPALEEAATRIWEKNNPDYLKDKATRDSEGNVKHEYTTAASQKAKDKDNILSQKDVMQYKDNGKFYLADKGMPGGTWYETSLPTQNPYSPPGYKNARYYVPNPEKGKEPKDMLKETAEKIKNIATIEEKLATDPDIVSMKDGTIFKDNVTGLTFKKTGGYVKYYGQ